jgi:hypothetical protein
MTEIIVEIKNAVVTLSHSGRGWEFVNEEWEEEEEEEGTS